MVEWSMALDCKSNECILFVGSNPTLLNRFSKLGGCSSIGRAVLCGGIC